MGKRHDPYKLESKVREYIHKNEDISVDWDGVRTYEANHCSHAWRSDLYYSRAESFIDILYDILMEENVLAIGSEENYLVMGCGMCINPMKGFMHLYFTEKKYAEEYKNKYYKDAMYSISIYQHS